MPETVEAQVGTAGDDLDLNKEIEGAMKPVYPPNPKPRVVLLPREAFFTMLPELEDEYQGLDDCPYVLVCNGTITMARIH